MFRTGEKLQQTSLSTTSSSSEITDSCCLLCGGVIDTATQEPCALQATKFSRIVSESGAVRLTGEFLRSIEKVKLSTEGEGEGIEASMADNGESEVLQDIEEDKVS